MPPAARVGDAVGHAAPTGTIGPPGVPTVLIGGRPAAVIGTICTCAVPPQHALLGPGNVLVPGPPPPRGLVLIGGRPAARLGDRTTCSATILTGAANVFIGS